MFKRNDTKQIRVGDILIGGGAPITVQSMTNTDTRDAKATINQIRALEEAGCQIIRLAIPDFEAANAIKDIVKASKIPVVADIHFDYRLALKCIENGVHKIRINPGNIGDIEKTAAVVKAAKERRIPIRIGVNGGSLEKSIKEKYGNALNADAICESAMNHIKIFPPCSLNSIFFSCSLQFNILSA